MDKQNILKYLFIGLICFLVINGNLFAQTDIEDLTTLSKKAAKEYIQAEQSYILLDYQAAEKHLNKAISFDQDFIEAHLLLGDIYLEIENTSEAINSYTRAVHLDPDFYPPALYILAKLELNRGEYNVAFEYFNSYLNYDEITELELNKIKSFLETCEFAQNAIAHPVPFDPHNMGDSINTENNEYVDAITVDGETIYFTVLKSSSNLEQQKYKDEDFYYSDKINGTWTKARDLGPPVNTHENEGAMFISSDGRYLLMAGCNRDGGHGSCDIYISHKNGNSWGKPVNLGPMVNSYAWESQPCLASDGRTLFFASNRIGGLGKSDIWKTTYLSTGEWTKPENLGETINTPADEMSPFLHPDNQTLYFSSRGHKGMGGADLFVSRKDVEGNWSDPVNIGYPINTFADEINLIVNAKGDTAYFSSDKLGGFGENDIYKFYLYEEVQPSAVTYMKGKVFEERTGEPLEAWFELINLETGITKVESISDKTSGAFLVCLPTQEEYALNVRKEGYLFYSDNFKLTGENPSTDPYLMDIPLNPIKVGEKVILRNIFFDTDKYDLKETSRIELNFLNELLLNNLSLKIEIGGHTDNIGSEEYNKILSLNRAKAVYDYLIDNGISTERLAYQGYGFSQPVADNSTEPGRAMNRRTEIKVTGK